MTPDALIERALHQFQTGQFDGAAKACRRVLKANPRHVDALNLLGVVSFKAGDAGRAVENLQKALALDPVNPEIHKNLGFALRDLGRCSGAARACSALRTRVLLPRLQFRGQRGAQYQAAKLCRPVNPLS